MTQKAIARVALQSVRPLLVGLGEALVDVLPDGACVGGAPMNVAVHARQLGNQSAIVTRIGQDDFGRQILAELEQRQVDVSGVQIDPQRTTGKVLVRFGPTGEPQYDIVHDVAWDAIEFDVVAQGLAQRCSAICFGTLAQRQAQSRKAIGQLVEAAQSAVCLFDINLLNNLFDRALIVHGLEIANAAKFNDQELVILTQLFGLSDEPSVAAAQLVERFELDWVALTRGWRGTAVFAADQWHDVLPVAANEKSGDPVGAGDATAAALLHGAVRSWPWTQTLALANAVGAHVASCRGACPPLPDKLVELASASPSPSGRTIPTSQPH